MSVTIHISNFQLNDENIFNKIKSCLIESNLIKSQDHTLYLFNKDSKSCFHLFDEEFQDQFKFHFYSQQKCKVECINKSNIELYYDECSSDAVDSEETESEEQINDSEQETNSEQENDSEQTLVSEEDSVSEQESSSDDISGSEQESCFKEETSSDEENDFDEETVSDIIIDLEKSSSESDVCSDDEDDSMISDNDDCSAYLDSDESYVPTN